MPAGCDVTASIEAALNVVTAVVPYARNALGTRLLSSTTITSITTNTTLTTNGACRDGCDDGLRPSLSGRYDVLLIVAKAEHDRTRQNTADHDDTLERRGGRCHNNSKMVNRTTS
jgi:hypothetical protein